MTREKLGLFVILVATAAAVSLAYALTTPFLPALTWAVALAIIAHPLHERIRRLISNANVGALISVVVVAVVLIGPAILLTTQLVSQVQARAQSNGGFSQWQDAIQKNPKIAEIYDRIVQHVNLEQEISNAWTTLRSRISGAAMGFLNAVFQLCICLYALFFFFRDRAVMLKTLRSLLPLSAGEFEILEENITNVIHATIYGSLMTALIQGILGGLMFWFLGFSGALLLAFAMMIAALVPTFGTSLVWGPAVLYLGLQGEWGKALILLAWSATAVGLVDNFLYPILVGKQIRLHTLLIFLAVVGGITVFGVSGLVLGPVVVAIMLALLDILKQRTVAGRPAEQPV